MYVRTYGDLAKSRTPTWAPRSFDLALATSPATTIPYFIDNTQQTDNKTYCVILDEGVMLHRMRECVAARKSRSLSGGRSLRARLVVGDAARSLRVPGGRQSSSPYGGHHELIWGA